MSREVFLTLLHGSGLNEDTGVQTGPEGGVLSGGPGGSAYMGNLPLAGNPEKGAGRGRCLEAAEVITVYQVSVRLGRPGNFWMGHQVRLYEDSGS